MSSSKHPVLHLKSGTVQITDLYPTMIPALQVELAAYLHAYYSDEPELEAQELSTELFEFLFDFYQADMPYGTAKARTGDPYQWIIDKLISL